MSDFEIRTVRKELEEIRSRFTSPHQNADSLPVLKDDKLKALEQFWLTVFVSVFRGGVLLMNEYLG